MFQAIATNYYNYYKSFVRNQVSLNFMRVLLVGSSLVKEKKDRLSHFGSV